MSSVLYIHPSGHLNDLVVPTGALSCLNGIEAPKLGRYAFEVADEEIARAAVIACDVHWALALPGFERLVRKIRDVSPTVPIVVGGVTAGHFPGELLERFPVDYVLQGDSERAFAELVGSLLEGETSREHPNVHAGSGGARVPRRMTAAEFDATDPLSADWFPTYSRLANLDAEAFPQGRTIPVARGCRLRCPECYGSFANTFGAGYLLRTPARLVELMRQAERMEARNLRLFLGKPPPRQLNRLLREMAAGGPYRFDSAVGFYVCTPPELETLDALDAAFDSPITLSFIPPDEHVPVLSDNKLDSEEAQWRQVAERVVQSERLSLDVWVADGRDLEKARRSLTSVEHPRVRVSSAAVWAVTRPTDAGSPTFDQVWDAVEPTWTFYAARTLNPDLARLLSPFRYLDELDEEAATFACPDPHLAKFHELARRRWNAHKLPTLPGLVFSAVPLVGEVRPQKKPGPGGMRLDHPLGLSYPQDVDLEHMRAVVLEQQRDHKGITLAASLELPPETRSIAVVPNPLGGRGIDSDWLRALRGSGLVAVPVKRPGRAARLVIHVRVQQSQVALLDEDAQLMSGGRAHLGYFRTPGSRREVA